MSKTKDQLFQVDLRGVLDVFSNHLYSTSDVFIRELMQNGVDALRARREHEKEYVGKVTFELDRKEKVLTVVDTGVGLTGEQVQDVLSRIGSSSKRDAEERARAGYIGQFGIGILSCFTVCDEIVVLTQSLDRDEPSMEWIAKIDGTFTVRELKKQLNTGTRVVLKFNDEGKRYAKRGVIEEVVTRYGSRLGEQIVIKKKPYEQWVGEDHGWDFKLKTESDIEEFRDACWRLQYDRDFLGVFSLHHSRHKIRGFALIDGERVSTREHRRHKVYSNGMFVTDEPGELIPKWASFARIEVELNSIRLTASRESIYTDEQYGKVKKAISKMLLKQLLKLADSNPALLRELIEQNDGAFREIAFEDNEFFDAIVRHLPFETNQGSMKLEDYLKEHDVIRVAPIVEQFRMIGPIAGASGQVIFNGGYTRHAELLERAGARLKGVACEMIDARSYVENLGDADEDLV